MPRVPAARTRPEQPLHARPAPEPLIVEEYDGLVFARGSAVSRKLPERLHAGELLPERELDLHRLSAEAARHAIARAVEQARADKVRTLLVICGRGLHSGRAGAVLPEVARGELSDRLAAEVLAFSTAPAAWGGAGAWIVRLKKPA